MNPHDLDPRRWQQLWQALGAPASAPAFAFLRECYAQAGRHYHTAAHIQAMLHTFDELRELAEAPALLELAIWYHDAIYDPLRQDNEARSAERAVEVLQAAGLGGHADTVAGLIMATDHRQPATTADQCLLVDIDLSILAAPPLDYARYTCQVRQEYGGFADALYVPGRVAVLKKFLQRPWIFTCAEGQARWEARARVNIQGEIERLQSAGQA